MAADSSVAVSSEPGRCAFFLERKRRFCKMVPAQGKRFCGEHGAHEEEENRKRILCPLDPKHTVYEDQLQKHLKKCNSREKPKPVYFVQDINAGIKDTTVLSEEQQVPISSLSREELEDLIRKLRTAADSINYVLQDQTLSHPALKEALNDPRNGEAASKHLKQQASILGNMERLHLLGPGNCFVEFGAGRGKLSHWVDIALEDAQDVHFLLVERATTRFKVDGKHRKNCFERLQVDIQHLCLNKVPVLVKEKLPVVGIGKHVCGSATDVRNVVGLQILLDCTLTIDYVVPTFRRATGICYCLEKSCRSNNSYVSTDLALKCLLETYTQLCDNKKEDPAPKRLKTNGTTIAPNNSDETCRMAITKNRFCVAGIVIALCCHHRCEWEHYVGQEFFRRVGLGAMEFNYLKRLTSWATCGMRDTSRKVSIADTKNEEQSNEVEEHDQDDNSAECSLDSIQGVLTTEERKQIGYLCKLLIDYGRIEYLQKRGYEALLQHYTDLSVSLENVLLTAVPCWSSSAPPSTA